MAWLAQNAAHDPVFTGHILEIFDSTAPSLSLIEEWIREHFVYQPELVEIVRTPQFMLRMIFDRGWFSGDCDDAATFAAALLRTFAYRAEFVAIRYSHASEFEHVFVRSGNFVVDPTVPYGTDYLELERMTYQI